MSVEKLDGDPWGAQVRFEHLGQSLLADVGVCLPFGNRGLYSYRWITAKNVLIPKSYDFELVGPIKLSGIWDSHDFAVGAEISAQSCVAPVGKLPRNNAWTRKYADDLHDVPIYAGTQFREERYFKNMGGGGGEIPEGKQLTKGRNLVAYLGPSQSTAQAVQSMGGALIIIWALKDGQWLRYDPHDIPGNTLVTLNNGDAMWVDVTQDIFWRW